MTAKKTATKKPVKKPAAAKAPAQPKAPKTTKVIDWVLVEKDYRAGIKPLRQIGQEAGVSHTAVQKKAEVEGWTRDLKERIAAKAEEKVAKAAVSTQVAMETKVAEAQVVEANAQLQYNIRMEHRQDIKRSRGLFGALLQELEILTGDDQHLFHELGELLDKSGPDSNGTWREDKLNKLYAKIISLDGRVDNAKKLAEMLERVIKLERQAFGIKDEEQKASALDELLLKLNPPGGA